MNSLRTFVKTWMALGILLGTMAYAIAEDITVVTYYSHPSGAFGELRTTNNTYLALTGGNVGIGTTAPQRKLDIRGGIHINVHDDGGPPEGEVAFIGNDTQSPQIELRDHDKGKPGGDTNNYAYIDWANDPDPTTDYDVRLGHYTGGGRDDVLVIIGPRNATGDSTGTSPSDVRVGIGLADPQARLDLGTGSLRIGGPTITRLVPRTRRFSLRANDGDGIRRLNMGPHAACMLHGFHHLDRTTSGGREICHVAPSGLDWELAAYSSSEFVLCQAMCLDWN